jgi:hypothetical protein
MVLSQVNLSYNLSLFLFQREAELIGIVTHIFTALHEPTKQDHLHEPTNCEGNMGEMHSRLLQ